MSRDLSVIGRALSAPVRAIFLNMLMDGSIRPASELAVSAGVTAPTASEHLAVLLDAGLVTRVPRGRQRFYALADPQVASALEQLGHLCPVMPTLAFPHGAAARDLAQARLCYDHLAGRLGVTITDALISNEWTDQAVTALTPHGHEHLRTQRIDVNALTKSRRPLIRACPDWTERKPHLAGSLGAAVASLFIEQKWVLRRAQGRGLTVTPSGVAALRTSWDTEW